MTELFIVKEITEAPLHHCVVHGGVPPGFISQKVSIKSFCKNQFSHKSVNLFLI